jgi:WXG100 family type VII secretion target
MTGPGLVVDHAALQRMADELRGAVAGIDARLDRLEHDLAPLRSEWGGLAHDAYAVAKAAWDGAMLEMRTVLADTSRAVLDADAGYLSTDRSAASAFQQL